jgi:hypothetical protein
MKHRRFRWLLFLPLLLAMGGVPVAGQEEEEEQLRAVSAVGARIDSIRDDLVELRFEKALAAIEALMGEPDMSEAERAELLVLRSQAHVAFGDLDAAERDFGEILTTRPGFAPDSSLTPKKAMDRFKKVQSATIGWLEVEIDPPDARLIVNGRQIAPGPGGLLALLAGEHELRVEQEGFDPAVQSVTVGAGKTEPLRVQLVPNARTIVLRTEPEGVEVLLDGNAVGTTERPQGAIGVGGELVIANVPLGEHVFELRKDCYRSQRVRDNLTVDLLDRTPKRYRTVVMTPARSTLAVTGGPEGAELTVDGEPAGRLPLEPLRLCPGSRAIGVRFGGRWVWVSIEVMEEGQRIEVEVRPRPNAVVVGAESWPGPLASFAERFNLAGGLPMPAGVDLSTARGWDELSLPAGTDVAVAVVPAGREGMRDDWFLYSPILRAVREIEVAPPAIPRPQWRRAVWGFSVVDSSLVGSALVVEVHDGGAAAAAALEIGDRIASVGGREVGTAAEVRAALGAEVDVPVEMSWTARDGESREGVIRASWSPSVDLPTDSVEASMERTAWAVVDSICDRDRASAALANLALLFAEFGHHDLAAETWQRVRWGERRGIGEGTTQYYLGRELERLGREREAVQAYHRAAASASTAFDDEGPRIAPAALDRLADLGVTSGIE